MKILPLNSAFVFGAYQLSDGFRFTGSSLTFIMSVTALQSVRME